MKSGVYKICNIITNKIYIGSAVAIKSRILKHFWELKNNKHCNKYLQHSFNKYGEENFKFEVIEYCEKEKLIEREQYYMDLYKACELGYNLSPTAGSTLGIKLSEEHISRLRDINTGRKHTNEALLKMSKVHKGVPKSEEHKQKIGNSHRGKKLSENHKLKLSNSHRGKKFSEETKIKMSNAHKGLLSGIPKSDEHKLKLSIAHKGKRMSEEHKQKISMTLKSKPKRMR